MGMSMVEVGPMRMGMGHGFVSVLMGMLERTRLTWMDMRMVSIIMTVGMQVLHLGMLMPMNMPVTENKGDAPGEYQRGQSLHPG